MRIKPHKEDGSVMCRARKYRGQAISEFGPAIFIFFIIIFFPMVNLITFSLGVAGVQFLVSEVARTTSASDSRQNALNSMANRVNEHLNSGLLSIGRAQAVNGYNNCGCTLLCKLTSVNAGTSTLYNLSSVLPLANQPQTGTNSRDLIYQYVIDGNYKIYPLLDMSAVPGLGNIPGLAGSSVVHFTAIGTVENPQALQN